MIELALLAARCELHEHSAVELRADQIDGGPFKSDLVPNLRRDNLDARGWQAIRVFCCFPAPRALLLQVRRIIGRYAVTLPVAIVIAELAFTSGRGR